MSILDVTEDQIFHTLGRGRDPNFKQIEKPRPPVQVENKPKRTYGTAQVHKPVYAPQLKSEEVYQEPPAPPEIDLTMKKLTEELSILNSRVDGIQTIVKWYIVPQFVLIVALIMALFMKEYITRLI